MPGLRAAVSIMILFVLFSASSAFAATPNAPSAGMSDAHEDNPSVLREDERTFHVSRRGSPYVPVTFLSARTFRLRLVSQADPIDKLPEYMGVRSMRAIRRLPCA